MGFTFVAFISVQRKIDTTDDALIDEQVQGKAILPAAAMFEAARAAGETMLEGARRDMLALTAVSIPAPFFLGTEYKVVS